LNKNEAPLTAVNRLSAILGAEPPVWAPLCNGSCSSYKKFENLEECTKIIEVDGNTVVGEHDWIYSWRK